MEKAASNLTLSPLPLAFPSLSFPYIVLYISSRNCCILNPFGTESRTYRYAYMYLGHPITSLLPTSNRQMSSSRDVAQ